MFESGAHTHFQNPWTNPSGRKATQGKEKRKKKENAVNRGQRPRVAHIRRSYQRKKGRRKIIKKNWHNWLSVLFF